MNATPRKEKLQFLDTLVTVHLGEKDNADGLSVIEHSLPYGFSPPLHIHHGEDEVFHIIDGEARFVVGGKDIHVRAGDTLVGPKGVPHSFIVISPQGARWLNVTKGGDFERMLREASRPAAYDQIPAAAKAPTPAEAKALQTACSAHGIELVGPPLTLAQVFDHAYV